MLNFIEDNSYQLSSVQAKLNDHLNKIRSNINWVAQWGQPILEWMERASDVSENCNSSASLVTNAFSYVAFYTIALYLLKLN
jgi:hypothetical protein